MKTLTRRITTLIYLFGEYVPFDYFQVELFNSLNSQRYFMRKGHTKISVLGFTERL